MQTPRSLSIEALECRRLLAATPTAAEQELLQLVNRFRTDPRGEFTRLISVASPIKARDPILQPDLDYAGVDGNVLRTQLQSLTPVAPVAWNGAIADFAKAHNAAMLARNPPQQFHSDTLTRRQTLLDAGVKLRFAQGEKINSENIYGYGKSPLHTYAAWVIDWQRGGPSGMQSKLGHRTAIINPDYEQLGQAITTYTGSNFGPQVNTQILANIENPPIMVVGALFEDRNKSGWYEAGEGIGNGQIVFEGPAGRFTTTSMSAGGYQIELPPGAYKATASGGGMKHSVVASGITVQASNVWRNLIYDPAAIPPDAIEANNSLATATLLSGQSQTLRSLSIHTPSDVDYFRLTSVGTGTAQVTIDFSHAAGNLDLRLLDASGKQLSASTTTTNRETITANLTRGTTYYVQVNSVGGATNGNYTLTVVPPQAVPPQAVADFASTHTLAQVSLNVVANDLDTDGDRSKLSPRLVPGTHSAFSLNGNTLAYKPPAGYSGVHRAQYVVRDDQGLDSAPGTISIFVVNLAAAQPWKSPRNVLDVNDDGLVSAVDALALVNGINARGVGPLPVIPVELAGLYGFLDPTGDGILSALDVLMVVNVLNVAGEGEAGASTARRIDREVATDLALDQLSAAAAFDDLTVISRRQKLPSGRG